MAIGTKIRAIRERLGVSQSEMARRAGLVHSTYYKIESGERRDPQISIVARIARALGITLDELVGEEFNASAPVGVELDITSLSIGHDEEIPYIAQESISAGAVLANSRQKGTSFELPISKRLITGIVERLTAVENKMDEDEEKISDLTLQVSHARKAAYQTALLFEQVLRALELQENPNARESLSTLQEIVRR